MSLSQRLFSSRLIRPFQVETPLLVPSFSSRGFPDVQKIVVGTQADLFGVCLLSAFDLANGFVNIQLPDLTDVLVIDSGGYETQVSLVALDERYSPPATTSWDRASYRTFIGQCTSETNIIAVSFDHYGSVAA